MDPFRQASKGNVDFFEVADHQEILDARDALGESVLLHAVEGGRLECCKVILRRWPDLLYEPNMSDNGALIYAVMYARVEIARFLVLGAEQRLFRMAYVGYASPLHYAITRAELEIVQLLTEADPDFDSIPPNEDGETPQMLAERLASEMDGDDIQVEIKDWILKKIEEKRATPTDLELGAIHRATKGDVDFFRTAQVKESIEPRDINGNSILAVAVLHGHFACSEEILVIFPALLNLENTNGETPLTMAQRLASGKTNDNVAVKIKNLLLVEETRTKNAGEAITSGLNKAGGDENQPDPDEESSGSENVGGKIIYRGHKDEGYRKYIDHPEVTEPFKQAAIGNVDYFKVADDKDILHARNAIGETVLLGAVKKGHLECSRMILARWPDLLYVPNINGNTALIYAIIYNEIDIAKFLIVGAEQRLFRMAYTGYVSPLHYSIRRASLEMVKILTEADPDFDSIPGNSSGETPQMLAVTLASYPDKTETQVQIKDYMIRKVEEKRAALRNLEADAIDLARKGNADFFRTAQVKESIEPRDKNGDSVLSVAVLNGHFECSKVILVRFPDLLYQENTNEKHTPLHHAVWRGIPQIVELLAVGANKKLFRMQNISGSTPMHLAISKEHLEIVKILTGADPDYNELLADNDGETPLMMAQRLASAKMNDDLAVKIRDLLLAKQTATKDDEEEATLEVNEAGGDENQG